MLNEIEGRIKGKIEAAGIRLKEWAVQINYGIKTGCNGAFIIDTATKNKLLKDSPKSAEIIRPILRGRDIKRYTPQAKGQWFLITLKKGWTRLNGKPKNNDEALSYLKKVYPAVASHLQEHSEKAAIRQDKGEYWWELRACDYYDDFDLPKLVYPEISKHQPFVIDQSGQYYANNKAFILTGEALYFLAAFCNSRLFRFCFLDLFPSLGSDRREMRKVSFEQLSIKRPTIVQQKEFENLVKQILVIKAKSPVADVSAIEAEINSKLYEMYELTEAEIALIEAKSY